MEQTLKRDSIIPTHSRTSLETPGNTHEKRSSLQVLNSSRTSAVSRQYFSYSDHPQFIVITLYILIPSLRSLPKSLSLMDGLPHLFLPHHLPLSVGNPPSPNKAPAVRESTRLAMSQHGAMPYRRTESVTNLMGASSPAERGEAKLSQS